MFDASRKSSPSSSQPRVHHDAFLLDLSSLTIRTRPLTRSETFLMHSPCQSNLYAPKGKRGCRFSRWRFGANGGLSSGARGLSLNKRQNHPKKMLASICRTRLGRFRCKRSCRIIGQQRMDFQQRGWNPPSHLYSLRDTRDTGRQLKNQNTFTRSSVACRSLGPRDCPSWNCPQCVGVLRTT